MIYKERILHFLTLDGKTYDSILDTFFFCYISAGSVAFCNYVHFPHFNVKYVRAASTDFFPLPPGGP